MDEPVDFIRLLSDEVAERILTHLELRTLLSCRAVSRTWNERVCSHSRVWRQACERLNINIIEDETRSRRFWNLFLQLAERRQEMKTFACFTPKSFRRLTTPITAIYYYNGKLGIACNRKIEIWDCNARTCLQTFREVKNVAAIKFDDSVIIVISNSNKIESWNISSGALIRSYSNSFPSVSSFDFLTHANIVVAGSRAISIWNLSTGAEVKSLRSHTLEVSSVVLRQHPGKKGCKEQNNMLLSTDKCNVYVRTLGCTSELGPFGTIDVKISYIIHFLHPVNCDIKHCKSFLTPGLLSDEFFFFFSHSSRGKTGVLSKQNVSSSHKISEMDFTVELKALLGIGKKYAAIITSHRGKEKFEVKKTKETIVYPKYNDEGYPENFCKLACIGETSWLNGLDGANDVGVACAFVPQSIIGSVYTMEWTAKKVEEAAGTNSINCT